MGYGMQFQSRFDKDYSMILIFSRIVLTIPLTPVVLKSVPMLFSKVYLDLPENSLYVDIPDKNFKEFLSFPFQATSRIPPRSFRFYQTYYIG